MRISNWLALALVVAIPLSAAHPAPDPTGTPFRRLLADRIDDCGPEAGASQDCRGSDALLALDLKEAWDGAANQLVFRFYLDKGSAYPITDALALHTPAGAKTLSITTGDDATFQAQGFDSVASAQSLNDGTRFTVDATISYASLGVQVGDALTSFSVTSTGSKGEGDFMPGGCHNTVGDCTAGDTGEYVAGNIPGSFALTGPTYYGTLEGPTDTMVVAAASDAPLLLQLTNSLRSTTQAFTLSANPADGVTLGFHAGGDGTNIQYQPTATITLDGLQQSSVHVNFHGDRAQASGIANLTVTTDQGGRFQIEVPYSVSAAGATPPTSSPSGKHSPAPGVALVLALAAFGLLRRK
ncbi:MAG: hypothetical protein ACYDBQ_10765 [Thermoplasmatota archaeon]